MLLLCCFVAAAAALCTFKPTPTDASNGDVSPFFRHCLARCAHNFQCPLHHPMAFAWWARQQCFSCRQNCVWDTVERFRHNGHGTPQFFGKWPFAPLTLRLGPFFVPIQEPASVIFSLLNLYAVVTMQRRVRRTVPHGHHCRAEWLQFGWAGMLAWFCSALFHVCDHRLTEALDYGTALGLILFTLYASIGFVAPSISKISRQTIHISRRALQSIGASLFIFYVRYLHSMFRASRFDYGYHVRFCVCLSLLAALIYLAWALVQIWMGNARKSLAILAAALILGWFSAAFDAFIDFPPLFWMFDAHSLFHLFSIPIPLLWAEFICKEAERIADKKT